MPDVPWGARSPHLRATDTDKPITNKKGTVIGQIVYFFLKCWPFIYLLLAVPHGLQDLCSLTRDRTHAPCSGTVESNHWTTREVPKVYTFEHCLKFLNQAKARKGQTINNLTITDPRIWTKQSDLLSQMKKTSFEGTPMKILTNHLFTNLLPIQRAFIRQLHSRIAQGDQLGAL